MEGTITVHYIVLCDDDITLHIDLQTLLANEKIQKLIKSECAKGVRHLSLDTTQAQGSITLAKTKQHHTFTIPKDDFADALSLAEEDARSKKLFKAKCDRVKLIDLQTEETTQ